MARSILLAGGGTAGHVNPLLATAAELASRGHRVAALGTQEGLESDLVPRAGVDLHIVPRVPLPRRPSLDWFKLPLRLWRAYARARDAIDAVSADVVVGFGGYVSTPAYLAAKRRHVPIVVHEANAKPGLANRLGARLAVAVAVTFPDTPLPKAVVTGLPLRGDIAQLAAHLANPDRAAVARRDAREARGWEADAHVLLITGGSLGAASLNAATIEAVPTLVAHGVNVIHLTGRGKAEDARRQRTRLPADLRSSYEVAEYAHDMADVFSAASAVVCRSGAATVCEISALGLPAMYVPLPHGNGEQALNAASAVAAGAATLVRDSDLTPAALVLGAERMTLDPGVAARMSGAARAIALPAGAKALADIVESMP